MSLWAKLFSKQNQGQATEMPSLTEFKIPKHIAIIMDGNGRWAKNRHLPRVAGHKQGMETVKTVTKLASNAGVKVLTLYAFSTENWSRPKDEVSFLMKLPITFFDTFVPELIQKNIRVKTIGDISALPAGTRQAVLDAQSQTAENTGMILNFALNYGGQKEIVDASKVLAQKVQEGVMEIKDITPETFAGELTTHYLGDLANPDLIIRTSGEERLSNFLPYQAAYSEFYFTDVLWPDFDQDQFNLALQTYTKRDRRFGKVKA
ncbi:isoprenyl transferase [Fructobacillus ficulneus]|uniref:Isoprenyl transferase n=1 Tax=Fructobacillus ficulneus TaxID=157463 RepID=A0A0K8MIZ3_9LACO|nr:isoprenyl transferase [Fructobacillus ficulneus]GAP00527.1 undecaprenyl diphosphate synthase [Fructobacillus ficulneus]